MANEKTVTPIYQKLPEKGVLRVAAYCRVSSSQDEQLHSLAAQATTHKSFPGMRPASLLASTPTGASPAPR